MIEVAGTFDIECADWTHFLVGATYDPRKGTQTYESAEALLAELLVRGGTWWAHFGGGYDFLALAELLRRMGKRAQIDYSRGRCTRIVCGSLTLRDSFALVPLALDVAAELANTKAPAFPWGCTCDRDCGGYCYLSRRMNKADMRVLRYYCAGDVRALYLVLQAIQEAAEAFGLDLHGTLGRTAWSTAQRDLRLPDLAYGWQTWDRIAAANFGGRNACVSAEHPGHGAHFDLSSAYGAALAATEMPTGEPAELGARDARLALHASSPGVYTCTVEVPEDEFLPPLPWRSPQGRIAYPVGIFTGTWTLPELCAAIERGTVVHEVLGGVVWTGKRRLFSRLIERWYGWRKAAGKYTAMGQWLRLLPNALTGMFALQPLRETIRMHPEEIRVCLRDKSCRRGCTGRCGAYRQVDAWGHIWAQPFFRLGESAHVHWSAYLRSACRVAWLEGAEKQGRALVYGATDSIWTSSDRVPGTIGTGLGQWEMKHGFSEWECRGVGIYKFRDGAGKVQIRAAGAGKMTEQEWRAGRVHNTHGVLSLREAAQEGRSLFQRRERIWSLPRAGGAWLGDRKLDATERTTYPATVTEHLERENRGHHYRPDPAAASRPRAAAAAR